MGPDILPGDHNDDGTVDTADYVVWRKNPGAFGGDLAGYNTWRANFGATSGSGSSIDGAVPEPTTTPLLILGAALWTRSGRRVVSRVPTTR